MLNNDQPTDILSQFVNYHLMEFNLVLFVIWIITAFIALRYFVLDMGKKSYISFLSSHNKVLMKNYNRLQEEYHNKSIELKMVKKELDKLRARKSTRTHTRVRKPSNKRVLKRNRRAFY